MSDISVSNDESASIKDLADAEGTDTRPKQIGNQKFMIQYLVRRVIGGGKAPGQRTYSEVDA